MKFYEFGQNNQPVLLLLPGTCCHWKANFGEVIEWLSPVFHVVCVSYDGFDETEQTTFSNMLAQTEKVETYIKRHFNGKICAAYGCSLGGSFVGLLVQRQIIHIDHAILGSSDLDQAGKITACLQAVIVSQMIHGMLGKGEMPAFMRKRLNKKPEQERDYYEKMMRLFGIGHQQMAFVSKKSIYNQFYSDLITPLADDISVPGTTVHCFYAEKMGTQYLKRYQKHFASPDIRFHPLWHEELLISYPEQWVKEVLTCCQIKK